jgi:hypothetical protein
MAATATTDQTDDTGPPTIQDRIVTISQWWAHHQQSSTPVRLVDLRPSSDQDKRVLSISTPNSVVVSLPIEFLKARSFELPARHIAFSVLLQERDTPLAESILLGVRPGVRKKRPANPWQVTHVLLDSKDLWKGAGALGLVSPSPVTTYPLPRLWQPDLMVEKVILPLLKRQLTMQNNSKCQVLDLASGSGRDVAFLAEELVAAGFSQCRVIGIDHRYNEKETNIVRDFWKRRGIENETGSLKLDLSHLENLQEVVPLSNVSAMFCVRFWKPELASAISTSSFVPSGTIFGLSHFCKPHRGALWNFEHPSEKTVLERHELSELFSDEWKILHDEIALDSDHGRTMIHFVAQKL